MPSRSAAAVLLACSIGCTGGPRDRAMPPSSTAAAGSSSAPAITPRAASATAAPPTAAPPFDVAAFESRLEATSHTGQVLARQPELRDDVVLALMVDADGKAAGPRPSFPFRFRPRAAGGAAGASGEAVHLDGTLAVDETRQITLTLSLSTDERPLTAVDAREGAEGLPLAGLAVATRPLKVRFERDPSAPPSQASRLAVAHLWTLRGAKMAAPYAPATMEAVVVGTRLVRKTHPASFSKPGSGTWTLLRIMTPGEAYLAIDWNAGIGEVFPRHPGERTPVGDALFVAM